MLSRYYIFFSNNNINYLLIICYAENHILIAVLTCTHGGRLKDESKRFHFRDKLENIKQHLFGPNNGAHIKHKATAFETASDFIYSSMLTQPQTPNLTYEYTSKIKHK